MKFKIVSDITDIQTIARGSGVDVRRELDRHYGRGNWRKLKGCATVEYEKGRSLARRVALVRSIRYWTKADEG